MTIIQKSREPSNNKLKANIPITILPSPTVSPCSIILPFIYGEMPSFQMLELKSGSYHSLLSFLSTLYSITQKSWARQPRNVSGIWTLLVAHFSPSCSLFPLIDCLHRAKMKFVSILLTSLTTDHNVCWIKFSWAGVDLIDSQGEKYHMGRVCF